MKSLFLSTLIVLSLLFCATHWCNATIDCDMVDLKAAPCVMFAQGKVSTPPPLCCSGLNDLVKNVKSVSDKKDICNCLKGAVKNFAGVQDRFLSKIPASCKINVGFPISLNTNCNSLH